MGTASKNSAPCSHRAEAAFWLWFQDLIDTITIPGFRICGRISRASNISSWLIGKIGIHYQDLIATGETYLLDLDAIEETLDPNDILNLQCTSGSTGHPKASTLTHGEIYNAGRFISDT